MNLTAAKRPNDCIKNILLVPIQQKKYLFVILLLALFYLCTGKNFKNTQFDYLIFSQRWLPTACIAYIEQGSSSAHVHYCTLPKNFEVWAIHGLWPTQNNHLGPFYCNRSMSFDIKKLQQIETRLSEYWPNIEGGETTWSLWKHEWEKHGTCAAKLSLLNSEVKYFNATLKAFKDYSIQDLFRKKNFLPSPNPEINVSDLIGIIKHAFGKLPQIHCVNEKKNNQPLLSEIRLCYNKNLELMDCKSVFGTKFHEKGDVTKSLTNCPLNRKIVFPDKINPGLINKLKNSRREDYYDMLFNVLQILGFLQWAFI